MIAAHLDFVQFPVEKPSSTGTNGRRKPYDIASEGQTTSELGLVYTKLAKKTDILRVCFGKDVRPRFVPGNLRKLGEANQAYQFKPQIVCYLFPWPCKPNKSQKYPNFPFLS